MSNLTPSGLVFVGQILGKSAFVGKINRAPISKDYQQKQIKNGDILLTYIGMLCQGKPQYEAVREMMDDPGKKKVRRRRIRTVISNLMQFAGHLTEHAGRLVLAIGRSNRWRFTFKRLYDSFALVT